MSITKKGMEWHGGACCFNCALVSVCALYVYQLLRKDNTINFKEFNKAITHIAKQNRTSNADYTSGNKSLYLISKIAASGYVSLQSRIIFHGAAMGTTGPKRTPGYNVIKHYEAKGR